MTPYSESSGAPKVSVIVAAYNLERVVEKSIRSVLGQTLSDIEIVVCDDASTDGTYGVLARLAAEDGRIRLLRNEENKGQAYARNRCFAQARGGYFAIHDGDDFSLPERLRLQAEFLDAHPDYAFVSSCVFLTDDAGRRTGERGMPGEIRKEHFLWGLPFTHPACMFRRACIEAAGGYRVAGSTRFRGEDYDMAVRIYALGMKGFVMDARLYEYYEGSLALKRRKYRYRFAEAGLLYQGFRSLGLLPKGLPFVMKPLVVGLLPPGFLLRLRRMLHWDR